ncbi:FF domain-containing protein [Entamoeba marina]
MFKTSDELLLDTSDWVETYAQGKNILYQPEEYTRLLQKIEQTKQKQFPQQQHHKVQKKNEVAITKEQALARFEELNLNSKSKWSVVKDKVRGWDGIKMKELKNIFNEYVAILKEKEAEELIKSKEHNRGCFIDMLKELFTKKLLTIKTPWTKVVAEIKNDKRYQIFSERDAEELWKDFIFEEEKQLFEYWKNKLCDELKKTNIIVDFDVFRVKCEGIQAPDYFIDRLYRSYRSHLKELEQVNEEDKEKKYLIEELENRVKDILYNMNKSHELLYGDSPTYFLKEVNHIDLDEQVKLKLFQYEQKYLRQNYKDTVDDIHGLIQKYKGVITPNMSVKTFTKLYSALDHRVNDFEPKYIELFLKQQLDDKQIQNNNSLRDVKRQTIPIKRLVSDVEKSELPPTKKQID